MHAVVTPPTLLHPFNLRQLSKLVWLHARLPLHPRLLRPSAIGSDAAARRVSSTLAKTTIRLVYLPRHVPRSVVRRVLRRAVYSQPQQRAQRRQTIRNNADTGLEDRPQRKVEEVEPCRTKLVDVLDAHERTHTATIFHCQHIQTSIRKQSANGALENIGVEYSLTWCPE